MNFGKLLAAGKSIMNGRAEIAYRADKQFYLPKFGPAKNPFTKAPAETAAGGKQKEEKVAAREVEMRPALGRPAIPGQGSTESRPAPFAPVAQPELSLDSVKVVHNDLSDSEVEVVPLKSRSGVPELPPAKKSWEILGERLLRVTAL